MALSATLYHFQIALSDSDRGVYEQLDLRTARHPSESMRYLVTRILALSLFYEEGLAFSKGLSNSDEPAVWFCEPDGRPRIWIEIGKPSAERLHKASKAAERVVVCTTDPADVLRQATAGVRVHGAARIEIVTLAKDLVDALASTTERNAEWEVVHSGGHLYVTTPGATFDGAIERSFLATE